MRVRTLDVPLLGRVESKLRVGGASGLFPFGVFGDCSDEVGCCVGMERVVGIGFVIKLSRFLLMVD